MNGLILAGANSSRSVPRQNRVYDLRPEPADGEIFDRSRNGNNAILSTGWAVTLDGITGHLHVTFEVQQNVTVLTARVRSSTDTTFYAGTENASGTDTIVANDTWQDVSVTISDAVADELFVGSDDGSTNFFAGDICDVRVASVGTWYLNDHPTGSLDGLPAFDSSGNGNDGVHVGGTSIVGVGAPVPQTALQDWNRGFNLTPNIQNDATQSIKYVATDATGDGATFDVTGAPNTRYATICNVISGREYTVTFDVVLNSGTLDFDLEAVTVSTRTSFDSPGNKSVTLTADGSVLRLRFGSEVTLAQNITVSNVVVKDTAGYSPEDQSNPGFDVFGNAIANPRGYLLNPRGVAGDYAEILDDPSLDVTTEWSGALVGNLYNPNVGTDQILIGRYDTANNKRSWMLYFNDTSPSRLTVVLSSSGTASSGSLLYSLSDEEAVYSWSYNGGAPSFTFYKNGVALTPVSAPGVVPASLFTSDTPVHLFSGFDRGSPSDKQFGKMLMYNKALSDSEHAQLYRALRRYL
jgi:hypothetical protein